MKVENLQEIVDHKPSQRLALDAEELLKESYLLDLLPSAVYVCDITGIIRKYNKKAAELWGRKPIPGDKDERFCGAFRLYRSDGTYLPHHETPVAATLADGLPRNDLDVIIERPDLSRVIVNVNVVPIKNANGKVIGMVNCFHDITEQRKNARELERKRLELQDYVDNAAVGLHWVDANGIILWANQAELQMLGYTEQEYVGHHLSEFHVHKDHLEDILNRLCRNETLHQYEAAVRCKDGSTKVVQINSNVFYENGKFIHTRCFTVDITEQKKYLNNLEQSENRYRQLIESLPASLYTCDAVGRITAFNHAALNLWGRTPVVGQDVWSGSWRIYDTDGTMIPIEACPMAIALKEGRPVYGKEIIIERPDGSRRNVLPHPTPIFDNNGKVIEAVNMMVDITELRQAEKALTESEERFRKAADSAPVLLWMANAEGQRVFVNKSWREFTGEKVKQPVDDWKKYIHPGDVAAYLNSYNNAFITKDEFKIEYRLKRKDSAYRWMLEHGIPRYNASGIFEGFLASCIDIEEKKTLTEALEREVEKRTAELKQANVKLLRYNEQLEQFTYAASHDMKEPLRKIYFYNSYLYESLPGKLSDKQREYLERSIAAAGRMQTLIDDLLLYSTTASSSPTFERVALNTVIEEVLDAHKVTIDQKNAVIHMHPLPEINAIPFQMHQLFDNLIGNALKYHHPGRKPEVYIKARKLSNASAEGLDGANHYWKITIADNGIGFENQYASHIFNLFHRLHRRSEFPGSGIGLAICKKIVQNHEGHIKACGKPDEGAIFEIILPV